MGSGGGPAAAAVLGAEICAPLLLLCWLCCWPDDGNSETSSTGKHPKKPIISNESPRRRLGSSVASLHLPSTSGHKQPLSAHRSHEEIPSRLRAIIGSHTGQEAEGSEGRYHSAPSVIHEVLHRRDWERSDTHLYIPLKLPGDSEQDPDHPASEKSSPQTTAGGSSASVESGSKEVMRCKKHHTNIKKSRKEACSDDQKDTDASETPSFYIGDVDANVPTAIDNDLSRLARDKLSKQTRNETIRSRRDDSVELERYRTHTFDLDLDLVVDEVEWAPLAMPAPRTAPYGPPPSVEAVGWEGGACYLSERGSLARGATPAPLGAPGGTLGGTGGTLGVAGAALGAGGVLGARARHASDGDILAPAHRPQSGAFSESEVELDVEDEPPPPYEDLQPAAATSRAKETAI